MSYFFAEASECDFSSQLFRTSGEQAKAVFRQLPILHVIGTHCHVMVQKAYFSGVSKILPKSLKCSLLLTKNMRTYKPAFFEFVYCFVENLAYIGGT